MASISPVTSLPPIAAVDPPLRVADTADRGGGDRKLEPAVSFDISPEASKARQADSERRGFERDSDSHALVYRVTDTVSGDVIVQIPNEVIIKARVYGRQQNPPTGEIVEKRA